MIRSSSSLFWNTTRPCTTSSTTTSPSSGFLKRTTGRHARQRIGALAPSSVVARLLAARDLLRAHLFELFLAAVASIGLAAGQQLFDDFLVAIEALGLKEGTLVMDPGRPTPGHRESAGWPRPSSAPDPCPRSAGRKCPHGAARTANKTAPSAVRRCAKSRSGWEQIGYGRSWTWVWEN